MDKYIFSDEDYGKVLDNFVIGCVDTAVCYDNKVLLEKRLHDPISGEWWIFGGRILKGETLKQTASRGIKTELGLNLAPDRFTELGVYNLMWPTRREPNTSNGCHHLLIAHFVTIDEQEYALLNKYIEDNSMQAEWFDYSKKQDSPVFLPEINHMLARLAATI